jgi:hypothetical protein
MEESGPINFGDDGVAKGRTSYRDRAMPAPRIGAEAVIQRAVGRREWTCAGL